jgi:hypothetical protein
MPNREVRAWRPTNSSRITYSAPGEEARDHTGA